MPAGVTEMLPVLPESPVSGCVQFQWMRSAAVQCAQLQQLNTCQTPSGVCSGPAGSILSLKPWNAGHAAGPGSGGGAAQPGYGGALARPYA